MIKYFHLAIAFCLSGILWSGSVDAAEKTTIVAFGDSTTAARGKLKVYSELLRTELPKHGLPVRVVNAGIGGNHTGHAQVRFEKDVLSHNPKTVIIQFGINDAAVDVWKDPPATKSRISLAVFERNLRHFIRVLVQRKVGVILMTPNPLRWTPKMRELYGKPPYLPNDPNGFNIRLTKYADTVRRIARTENVPLIDVYRSFERYGMTDGQSVDDLLLDGIHPNDRGHRMVADLLIAELLKYAQSNALDPPNPAKAKSDESPADSSECDPSVSGQVEQKLLVGRNEHHYNAGPIHSTGRCIIAR